MIIRSYLPTALLVLALVGTGACKKETEKQAAAKGDQKPNATVVDKPVEKPVEKTVSTAPISSEATKHLPKECEVALHLNLGAILSAPPIKKHIVPALEEAQKAESQSKDKDKFQTFLKETGLNPLKDIKEVAACLTELQPNQPPKASMVVIGNFKPGLVDALAKTSKEKLVPAEIGGAKGYKDEDATVLQAADGSIVAGNDDKLIKATLGTPNGFGATLSKLGTEGVQVVVPESMVKKGFSVGNNPFSSFAGRIAGSSTLSIDVGNGVFELRISTADDKTATELGGVARLLLGQVPKGLQGSEAIAAAILSSAEISNDGSSFVFRIKVPEGKVDEVAKMAAASIRKDIHARSTTKSVEKKAEKKSTKKKSKK